MFDKLKGKFDEKGDSTQGPPPAFSTATATRTATTLQTTRIPFEPVEAPMSSKIAELGFSTSFASVSLHMGDRIRLMELPPEICAAVRNTIRETWPLGIQNEREYYGSLEFKMHGNPWLPSGAQAIHARGLTRGIMATLYAYGWVLYVATDISRKPGDKDNLFFRHQDPTPAPREWVSCTFSKGDRLRLIDAPPDLVGATVQALQPYIQHHEPYKVDGVYEIKFNGYPFMASGGETMLSRRIALQMFSVFERYGYTLYSSIDQKYGGENGQEVDSWHLSRAVGWAPGAPVYHQ